MRRSRSETLQRSRGGRSVRETEEDLLDVKFRGRAVTILKNGDVFFPGFRVIVTPKKYPTFDVLLDHLSDRLNLTKGVHRLYSMQGARISTLEQLDNREYYVASSNIFTATSYLGRDWTKRSPPRRKPQPKPKPKKVTQRDQQRETDDRLSRPRGRKSESTHPDLLTNHQVNGPKKPSKDRNTKSLSPNKKTRNTPPKKEENPPTKPKKKKKKAKSKSPLPPPKTPTPDPEPEPEPQVEAEPEPEPEEENQEPEPEDSQGSVRSSKQSNRSRTPSPSEKSHQSEEEKTHSESEQAEESEEKKESEEEKEASGEEEEKKNKETTD